MRPRRDPPPEIHAFHLLIPVEEWRAFRAALERRGHTAAGVMRSWLRDYVASEPEPLRLPPGGSKVKP